MMSDGFTDLSRVVVIGTSCSGKTTFAGALAKRLGAVHVELDRLYWLPCWIERDPADFLDRVDKSTAGASWIADGNYRKARELLWSRATAIVWLDYRFPLVAWRALKRTVHRTVSRQEICNGNRESLRKAFLSRDSILLWVITTHGLVRERSSKLFSENAYPNAAKIRLKNPRQTSAFLAALTPT